MRIYDSLAQLDLAGKRTAVAIGLFDGLHLGHKKVIRSAVEKAAQENLTSVVLTFKALSSDFANKKKVDHKIAQQETNNQNLENMGVDIVIILPFDSVRLMSPESFVRDILHSALRAKYISCGEDFRFGSNATGDVGMLARLGNQYDIEVTASPLVIQKGEPISSTRIRIEIEDGRIPEANDMLGYRYSIDFEVQPRKTIDKQVNLPTINQYFPKGYLVPKRGVYATITKVDGRLYTSVTHVMGRDHGDGEEYLAESYIMDYSGKLYGRRIPVEFIQFLRPELKFDTPEELEARIKKDVKEAHLISELYI